MAIPVETWVPLTRHQVKRTNDLLPGEYTPIFDGNRLVVLRCRKCERLTSIVMRNHDIDHDGYVTPKCACPHTGCGNAQWVQLEGWIPAAKGQA